MSRRPNQFLGATAAPTPAATAMTPPTTAIGQPTITSLAASAAAKAVTSPNAQTPTRPTDFDLASMARVTAVHMNQRRR